MEPRSSGSSGLTKIQLQVHGLGSEISLGTLLRSHRVLYTIVAMVFTAPSWVPKLPFDPPDSIPISEFMLNEDYGRHPLHHARPPFTCGLSGAEYSALEVRDRVEKLTKGLSKELGWHPNKGTEWDKVIGVFSLNTVRSSIT